jgi:[ribosomal protein S5]-alanine N-acetyltransferase
VDTPRLRLIPYGPGHFLALIEGLAEYEAFTGIRAAAGLRDFVESGEVSPAWFERLRAATAADVWEHGFGVVHRDDELVIGGCMFKGPPDADGVVEIAYGIVPSYERQGYATEAAAALVAFASADPRVKIVRAHTLATNNASTRVLVKNGFTFVGEVIDPEDGPVWRWDRKVV